MDQGGNWLIKPDQIKLEFFNYFKNFLTENFKSDIFLLGTVMERVLSDTEAASLVHNVSMGEMEYALHQSPSNKAPGPDGFDAGSLKKMWEWIKDDLLQCVNKFMDEGCLPGVDRGIW